MSLIQVTDLTFSYDGSYDLVFDHVSFQWDTDWRLGLIGRNGRGKSTFCSLLMDWYSYSGSISSNVQFDYFPYQVEDTSLPTMDVLQAIAPQAQQWELMRELSLLELDFPALDRPFETLSNGEQTKALLAALFCNEGRFLLLNEPTNHLDVHARALVAAYLKQKKDFLLICHDRVLLDGCVDHILYFGSSGIQVQSGSFSSWLENKRRLDAYEQEQAHQLKTDIRRLKEASSRTSAWSEQVEKTKYGTKNSGLRTDRGYLGHKSAKLMKRAKALQSRQEQALAEASTLLNHVESNEPLKLSPLHFYSETLLSLRNIRIFYAGREVCGPVNAVLRQGMRMAITGKNGSGKSSLLNLICHQPIDYTGSLYLPEQLLISYVSQDTSHLQGTLDAYARQQQVDESQFKAILRKLGFARVQFEKPMQELSQGQKKKVLLARSLCQKAHLYVWDEPLTFLDLQSRMQIEALLLQVKPTMLFVEHDSAFLTAIATEDLTL